MFGLECRSERERRELLDAIVERIAFIRESTDRIDTAWALNLMAEYVERLDQRDRLDGGFMPPQLRPPLMIRCREAKLVLQTLRNSITGMHELDVPKDMLALINKVMDHLGLARD